VGSEMMRYLERMMVLQVVDSQWKDHLLAMDHLKEGIGLRGYGQRDPLVEYKKRLLICFLKCPAGYRLKSLRDFSKSRSREVRKLK
jgi:preprotein translocase subunit SecA